MEKLAHDVEQIAKVASYVSPEAALLAPQLYSLQQKLHGRQHTLRDMYTWIDGHGPLDIIKMKAKQIPIIGSAVAHAIEGAQDENNTLIRGAFGTAWNRVVESGSQKINRMITKIKVQTNVQNMKKTPTGNAGMSHKSGNVSDFYDQKTGQPMTNPQTGKAYGIAPGSYTPPSHTEVAKDHGDVHGPQGKDEDEAPEHKGAWLNGLAMTLAMNATNGVGAVVSELWNIVDQGGTIGATDARLPGPSPARSFGRSRRRQSLPTWAPGRRSCVAPRSRCHRHTGT
jgi:hypothetical protein